MLGIFKSILLTLLSPLRWFFNYFCKRRFRKLTYSKSEENLAPSCDVNNSRDHTVLDFDQQQSWNNDWNSEEDEKAAKIEQYRRELVAASNKEDEIQGAEDVNFFADMEPQNVRQPKVFVGQQNKSDSKSRLSISIDDPSLSCPPVDTVSLFFFAIYFSWQPN